MAEQAELELALPDTTVVRRHRRPAFAGFSRSQILAGAFVLGAMIWGMWVTKELVKPHQERIVAARLSSIVGDYVQAQARSVSPPSQVEAEMRKFMASLDSELAQRARKGEVVLVGEAVLSKNVPDITDNLREAVYASGIARPRLASAAELQRLQNQALVPAQSQVTIPTQSMMPMDIEPTAPGDGQAMQAAPGSQFGATVPTVSIFEGSGGDASQ